MKLDGVPIRSIVVFVFLAPLLFQMVQVFRANSRRQSQERELVLGKPAQCISPKENIQAYQNNRVVGDLDPSACCYEGARLRKPKWKGVVCYGWIWRASVNVQPQGEIEPREWENLRTAANRHILGRVNQFAVGRYIYENPRKSWVLARFDFEVLGEGLGPERGGITFNPTMRTATTVEAGQLSDESSSELDFLIFVFHFWSRPWNLVALVTIVAVAVLGPSVMRRRSGRKAPNPGGRADV